MHSYKVANEGKIAKTTKLAKLAVKKAENNHFIIKRIFAILVFSALVAKKQLGRQKSILLAYFIPPKT